MDICKHTQLFLDRVQNKKIVAAVSGGPDSVVMLNCLHKCGVELVVAHCNFHLRGEESDADEAFVTQLCNALAVKCFVKHFDTEKYALQSGISIEMAARELRYDWFYVLAAEQGCDAIAVAHNADDNIETFFLNLIRSTGLRGLSGMAPIQEKNGIKLIRPLLSISRSDIEQYIEKEGLKYRIDSTNEQDIYLRNNIRHNIVPALCDIKPSFRQSMLTNFAHLAQSQTIVDEYVKRKLEQVVVQKGDIVSLDIEQLLSFEGAELILFEFLSPYNFSPAVIVQIYNALTNRQGQRFYAPQVVVVVTSTAIEIVQREDIKDDSYVVTGDIVNPVSLSFERLDADGFCINKSANVANLDGDKVKLPLVLRRVKDGDSFVPFGMKGSKKVNDFLADKGINSVLKKRVWLLVDTNGRIVWVVGHRIDTRFAVTSETKQVLKITYK